MRIIKINGDSVNQVSQYVFARYLEATIGEEVVLDDSGFFVHSDAADLAQKNEIYKRAAAFSKVHCNFEIDNQLPHAPKMPLLSELFTSDVWQFLVDTSQGMHDQEQKTVAQQILENGADDLQVVCEAEYNNLYDSYTGRKTMSSSNTFNSDLAKISGDVYYHGNWAHPGYLAAYKETVLNNKASSSGKGKEDAMSDQEKAIQIHKDMEEYNYLNVTGEFPINKNDLLIYAEWDTPAGSAMNDNYFLQDLWGARKIFEAYPAEHYDIGSMVNSFIAHLLSFNMKVVMIDIRPLETYNNKNITFIKSDATNLLQLENNSIESLSALCSLEHFGLGRYGDKVDPIAHLKAFDSIQRVMKPGGNIYISLPAWSENRLQFNAHRLYKPQYVVDKFNLCDLVSFSLTSSLGLLENIPLDYDFKGAYCFGLFHFKKR